MIYDGAIRLLLGDKLLGETIARVAVEGQEFTIFAPIISTCWPESGDCKDLVLQLVDEGKQYRMASAYFDRRLISPRTSTTTFSVIALAPPDTAPYVVEELAGK